MKCVADLWSTVKQLNKVYQKHTSSVSFAYMCILSVSVAHASNGTAVENTYVLILICVYMWIWITKNWIDMKIYNYNKQKQCPQKIRKHIPDWFGVCIRARSRTNPLPNVSVWIQSKS